MLVASLLGMAAGSVAFALLFRIRQALDAGPGDEPLELVGALAMGLYVSAFGWVWVFPSVLIWLAAFVRADMAIARPLPGLLFGLACGAAAAVAIWVPVGAGVVLLDLGSTLFLAAIGAVVGSTTWSGYVLLSRSLGARARGSPTG